MTEGRRLLLLALARTKIRYMARRCRVTENAVYNWRSGHFVPGPRCRNLLEKIYGIPADTWFSYTP
jgi:hypothetical protein